MASPLRRSQADSASSRTNQWRLRLSAENSNKKLKQYKAVKRSRVKNQLGFYGIPRSVAFTTVHQTVRKKMILIRSLPSPDVSAFLTGTR
jgi:hypothetical protein